MTSTTDLSSALDKLSLSEPLPPAADFTLICSDGRAVSVNAQLLQKASRVFEDMLEMGSGELSCEVSESFEEVERVVEAISGSASIPSNKEWTSLARIADKYDVGTLRDVLLNDARARVQRDPIFAFSAAVRFQDALLAAEAATASLGFELCTAQSHHLFRQLSGMEKQSLITYHAQHVERAKYTLNQIVLGKQCSCIWHYGPARPSEHADVYLWSVARGRAIKKLPRFNNPVQPMQAELDKLSSRCSDCKRCSKRLSRKMTELRGRWAGCCKPQFRL
ncbi:hypothetical protein JCM10207_008029 [Rhodosporidiobolus poonsookiae]